MRLLCVGDLHIKPANLYNAVVFTSKIVEHIKERQSAGKPYNSVCLMGDVLDTSTHIHAEALTQIHALISAVTDVCPMIILVGNHCMTNSSVFLTKSHWMHSLKRLDNVTVVDDVTQIIIDNCNIIACPFVPNGRLVEALNTKLPEFNWRQSDLVLGHQLVDGAKMGAIVAENVEQWLLDYPMLVTGHVHMKQRPQPNLVYTGSAWQHSFAESLEKKCLLSIEKRHAGPVDQSHMTEVYLSGLTSKKLIHCTSDTFDRIRPEAICKHADVKVCFSGTLADFKALKTNKVYKALGKLTNVSVVFKPTHKDLKNQTEATSSKGITKRLDFRQILKSKMSSKQEQNLFDKYITSAAASVLP